MNRLRNNLSKISDNLIPYFSFVQGIILILISIDIARFFFWLISVIIGLTSLFIYIKSKKRIDNIAPLGFTLFASIYIIPSYSLLFFYLFIAIFIIAATVNIYGIVKNGIFK